MELTIIGSNSRGNAYVLQNANEALIIEAGCSEHSILKALGFNTAKVAACVVSHEHLDHAKYVHKLQNYGIRCYMSAGTASKCDEVKYSPELIKAGEQFHAGRFCILPFDTHHDAAEPLGFLIHHPEIGTMLFAVDTCYLSNTFDGLNNVMIECNYSDDILERNIKSGLVHPIVQKHVLTGHMSLQTCIQALQANDLSAVNNIILLHLSSENSDAVRFKREVELATGKNVLVAKKGMTINFGKTPWIKH